ncbi:RNAase [Oribacterium sp. oral taxon 102]|nr:RNAase [Oribacterium sp. oral taxon 102]
MHTPELQQTSPLALAYLGDCLYDLAAREYVLCHFPGNVNRMNTEKKKLVCAAAQAEIMGYLIGQGLLSTEELSVYRRGRNHKSESHSKNSSIQDYRRATGFEALIGYLYLREDFGRMLELVSRGMRHLLETEKESRAGRET